MCKQVACSFLEYQLLAQVCLVPRQDSVTRQQFNAVFSCKTCSAVDQAEDLAFSRGLFDEIISIAAPADSNAIDPGHVIGALEFMKDNGDIHPEVVVDLQNLLSKVIQLSA